MRGLYVFADYLGPDSGPGTGQVFTLNYNGSIASNFQNITAQLFPTSAGGFTLSNPSSLGEDANGELYITDIGNGSVFKSWRRREDRLQRGHYLAKYRYWQRLIWVMNGPTFRYAVNLPTEPTNWSIAGAGDFNGDGNADIIWQNTVTGERGIWVMNGTTLQYAANLPTEPTNWSIAGAGDFNGDGKSDIIWQNTVTGQRGIWIMNGTTLQYGASLPTEPTA